MFYLFLSIFCIGSFWIMVHLYYICWLDRKDSCLPVCWSSCLNRYVQLCISNITRPSWCLIFNFFKKKKSTRFCVLGKKYFSATWFLLQRIEQRFLAELIFTSQEFWYTMLLITNCDPSFCKVCKSWICLHDIML